VDVVGLSWEKADPEKNEKTAETRSGKTGKTKRRIIIHTAKKKNQASGRQEGKRQQ
jgi:hypothetical protein